MSCEPIDASKFCTFSAEYPADDWIEAIYIEDQDGNVLLDLSYETYGSDGYRDETENIIEVAPGDTLTISVTVQAGDTSWAQYMSWGHSIDSEDLVKVEDLYGGADCPWTHTYTWTVPDAPGAHLISWWEDYDDYTEPCDEDRYHPDWAESPEFGERIDCTLCIVSKPKWAWQDYAPSTQISLIPLYHRQEIYVVWLEYGDLEHLDIPVNTINLRLRDGNASYIRVTVMNPLRYVDDILLRSDGVMRIFSGYRYGKARNLFEVIYANIQSINLTRGSRDVLTLVGTRYRTTSNPQTVDLSGVQSIHENDGSYRVRAAMDWSVRPSDTVTLQDGSSFVVGLMQCAITHNNAWMILEGEAA